MLFFQMLILFCLGWSHLYIFSFLTDIVRKQMQFKKKRVINANSYYCYIPFLRDHFSRAYMIFIPKIKKHSECSSCESIYLAPKRANVYFSPAPSSSSVTPYSRFFFFLTRHVLILLNFCCFLFFLPRLSWSMFLLLLLIISTWVQNFSFRFSRFYLASSFRFFLLDFDFDLLEQRRM